MKKLSDRQILILMVVLSSGSLACYTAVMRLCHLDARQPNPQRALLRRRLAYVAHSLDWTMNLVIGLVGIQRLFRDENFAGQHQPRWLKIYFIITGPLPTLGMLVALVTGHQWGERLGEDPRRRRIHKSAALVGYISWWLSMLPLFVQPLLNRLRTARPREEQVTEELKEYRNE